jgi:hypothetical protein
MKLRNFIASILIIGSTASPALFPKPAHANFIFDALTSDEMVKLYEYDRDVIDKQREAAGMDTTRSKMQRKIMACTFNGWFGSQCVKDWDYDGIYRGLDRAKNGAINGIKDLSYN